MWDNDRITRRQQDWSVARDGEPALPLDDDMEQRDAVGGQAQIRGKLGRRHGLDGPRRGEDRVQEDRAREAHHL